MYYLLNMYMVKSITNSEMKRKRHSYTSKRVVVLCLIREVHSRVKKRSILYRGCIAYELLLVSDKTRKKRICRCLEVYNGVRHLYYPFLNKSVTVTIYIRLLNSVLNSNRSTGISYILLFFTNIIILQN